MEGAPCNYFLRFMESASQERALSCQRAASGKAEEPKAVGNGGARPGLRMGVWSAQASGRIARRVPRLKAA